MKIEIGAQRPANFTASWPGEYETFSHFEFACGIPSVLYAVTTWKENGKANLGFNFAGSFTGDGDGYFALIPVGKHTHTYRNIRRTGQFVVNFISKEYFDGCMATIAANGDETDELEAGGFQRELAKTVACPRMKEAFLSLECKLEKELDLSGSGRAALVIGRVTHMAMQEDYAKGLGGKYGDSGFLLFANEPTDPLTGKRNPCALAVCSVIRTLGEG